MYGTLIMKTTDFTKSITSKQIKENINKMFGSTVNLESYSREQLEDMRNKLRTRVFQQENQAGINDLLTNETYQKNKVMLDLLNTRIKEMLGEDIKKLRDKLQQLDEAKKGVRAPKYTTKAKGSKSAKDYDGDGKVESPKDEVWGSRAKAAAKSGKPFSEGSKPDFLDIDKDGDKKEPMKKASKEKNMKEDSVEENRVVKGRAYGGAAQKDTDHDYNEKPAAKGSSEKSAADRARDKAIDKSHERSGKDWEARGYKRTVVKGKAQSGSKDDDDTNESVVAEKAVSKAQQKFMGMVHAAKKGEKPASKEVAKAAKGMSKKEAEKFASTKHKGLPEKKKKTDEATITFRKHVKVVNESISYLLNEDEEEKANTITAAGDIANDFTSWMQRVGQYQTKVMIELTDEIRHNFGQAEAEAFKQAVSPALATTLETLTSQREAISNAIASLAGGEVPAAPMGTEPGIGTEMPAEEPMAPAGPDEMNAAPTDEFAAADAAAGDGASGREMRESAFVRKLAESHSIISKLAK